MKLFELIFEYFISYLIVVLWRKQVTHRQLILIFPNFYQTFLKFYFLCHHTKILAAGGELLLLAFKMTEKIYVENL